MLDYYFMTEVSNEASFIPVILDVDQVADAGMQTNYETVINEQPTVDSMHIADPDLPVVWPHEYVQAGGKVEHGSMLTLAYRMGKLLLRQVHGAERTSAQQLLVQGAAMRRLNGPEAEPLADKYKFIALVARLGYTTPRQKLIRPSRPTDLDKLSEIFGPDDMTICKPYCASNGRGIFEMPANDLPQFLTTVDRSYIVQKKIPIKEEIRYIRHIDKRGNVIQRVQYGKEIPKIYAGGIETIEQLIAASDIPAVSKKIMRKRNAGRLGQVLPVNSAMHVPPTSNFPPKATVEWAPEHKLRVDNIDCFMRTFLADLQTAIGQPLPHLCFDLGIIDPDILNQPYNFEAIKRTIVPFEIQLPYTLFRYIGESTQGLRERWAVTKILWHRMALGQVATGEDESASPINYFG
ncbi:MAG: hypothetical protein ABWY71_02975 [Candidatus Saccharimonadales bacterium]